MSTCPNCGARIREDMNFCPKCGTSIKTQQAAAPTPTPAAPQPAPAPTRAEKEEKHEKQEKEEKGKRGERMEKEYRYGAREYSFIGPLIGGLVLIFLGIAFYLMLTSGIRWETLGALFFVLIGIVIIAGAAYAATMASRRHPQT